MLDSGAVVGHAAEPAAVLASDAGDLQDAGGQQGEPLVLGVHRDAVLLPADVRLRQAVDLALEPGHAGLLHVHRLGLDVEVCHGCGRQEGERRGWMKFQLKTVSVVKRFILVQTHRYVCASKYYIKSILYSL